MSKYKVERNNSGGPGYLVIGPTGKSVCWVFEQGRLDTNGMTDFARAERIAEMLNTEASGRRDKAAFAEPDCSEWSKHPSGWGYHWLNRGRGYPEMVCVQPGPTYDQDGRSVEVWDCPGDRRSRLDARKMPKGWKWQKIPSPNDQAHRLVR